MKRKAARVTVARTCVDSLGQFPFASRCVVPPRSGAYRSRMKSTAARSRPVRTGHEAELDAAQPSYIAKGSSSSRSDGCRMPIRRKEAAMDGPTLGICCSSVIPSLERLSWPWRCARGWSSSPEGLRAPPLLTDCLRFRPGLQGRRFETGLQDSPGVQPLACAGCFGNTMLKHVPRRRRRPHAFWPNAPITSLGPSRRRRTQDDRLVCSRPAQHSSPVEHIPGGFEAPNSGAYCPSYCASPRLNLRRAAPNLVGGPYVFF